MTVRDRIRNSYYPVTDVTEYICKVMRRSGMELDTNIRSIVESNGYARLRDTLKAGKKVDRLVANIVTTIAVELGITIPELAVIRTNAERVLECEV